MLFPTTVFAIFFAIVFFGYWALPAKSLTRKVFLLAASVFFYAWWSWKFAIMMLVSAVINHCAAVLIAKTDIEKQRKTYVTMAVILNLAALAFFKYSGFLFTQCFMPLAAPVYNMFGMTDQYMDFLDRVLPFIETIVLPIGISFYTFQAIAYVVDVYRRKSAPAASLLDFANYLSFFPKLLAGPIVRASDLLPQMEKLPDRDTFIDTGKAVTLIVGGMFKKTVIANWLSQKLADPLFTDPTSYGWLDALLGTYGYTIQIYCDFSAYSDMAIGCALLLGFTFPENFRAPYFATSFQDFWRRWHISLSSWLRDYLYIPFGGSRCATWKVYRNLMLTMLLGGLWHGAGWTFILWGAIHGLAQVIERPFNKKKTDKNTKPKWKAATLFRALITFHVVAFAWIFFRAGSNDVEGIATVGEILNAFTRKATTELFSSMTVIMLVAGFLIQFLDGDTLNRVRASFNRLPGYAQGIIAALLLTIVLGFGPSGVAPFIYFQF